VLRELTLTPLQLLGAAAKALRAMDRARRIALLIAAGLVASLFAPWFVHTTVAHGLTGSRRLSESFTGWDALPAAAYACLAVAAVAWAVLFLRSGTVVSGLGADGRRAARARVDGVVVCVLGLAAVAWLVAALVDHPGSTAPAVGATTTVGVRWGLALALVLALALAGLGALMVRGAVRAGAPRLAGSPVSRTSRAAARISRAADATSPAASTFPAAPTSPAARAASRSRRAVRAARLGRNAGSAPVPAADPAMPDFDFAVSDEPVPSTPGSAERRAAGQPRGRKSGRGPGAFSRSAR
jgi:hypothetical protein